MAGLWLNIKRNKTYARVFFKGVHLLDIRVDEQNRGNVSFINLDANHDVTFKLVKEEGTEREDDYNQERFNK